MMRTSKLKKISLENLDDEQNPENKSLAEKKFSIKKVIVPVLYTLLMFIFLLIVFFPLNEIAKNQIEKYLPPSINMTLKKLDVSMFGSIDIDSINISSSQLENLKIKVLRLQGNISTLSLLKKKIDAKLNLVGLSLEVKGLKALGGKWHADVNIKNIDIINKRTGIINVNISGAVLDFGEKLGIPVKLDSTELAIKLKAALNKNVLTIRKASMTTDFANVQVTGNITLSRSSQLNMTLLIKPAESFLQKYSIIKGMLEAQNQIKDGLVTAKLSGNLKKPIFTLVKNKK